ncbi:hypothetical protein BDB00DRAFT_871879 [Zychaea mexicana]|uniref:uncharacterized protein n=1 Tax=Zychaea mexicana TaxID=64656 RepID=UPI0022FE72FB|nr:uncharacterized protein BDB00DRAFT_871879 [Zychaea mexicana]KAI9493862.1 hypothetical protein BDB00DRAFT_871879 [Zychaea mexicana]
MSNYIIATSPTSTRSRMFSPVILFHDHQFVKDGNGSLEHIHIPYGDPHYGRFIENHKKRIHRMLEHNERFWTDIREYTETQTSPIASVASSPTPPLYSHDELSPRRYRPYYLPRRTSTATQLTATAGSVVGEDSISVSSSSSSAPASPHSSSIMMVDPTVAPQPTTPTTPLHQHHHHHHLPPPPSHHSHSSHHHSHNRKASLMQQQQQPSPSSNNNGGNLVKRRRGNLPKAVTAILREWLSRHKKHPYPTEDEKATLARQTNLTLNQISNWFINARRRILQPMLQKERQARMLGVEEEDHGTLDILPYAAGDESASRRGRKRSGSSSLDVSSISTKYAATHAAAAVKRRTGHHPGLRRR